MVPRTFVLDGSHTPLVGDDEPRLSCPLACGVILVCLSTLVYSNRHKADHRDRGEEVVGRPNHIV